MVVFQKVQNKISHKTLATANGNKRFNFNTLPIAASFNLQKIVTKSALQALRFFKKFLQWLVRNFTFPKERED